MAAGKVLARDRTGPSGRAVAASRPPGVASAGGKSAPATPLRWRAEPRDPWTVVPPELWEAVLWPVVAAVNVAEGLARRRAADHRRGVNRAGRKRAKIEAGWARLHERFAVLQAKRRADGLPPASPQQAAHLLGEDPRRLRRALKRAPKE